MTEYDTIFRVYGHTRNGAFTHQFESIEAVDKFIGDSEIADVDKVEKIESIKCPGATDVWGGEMSF